MSTFLSQPFDGNSVWPVTFQSHTLGVGLVSLPADWRFFNGFLVDAARTESPWIDDAFGKGFAVSGEFGVLAQVADLPARLSFAWCRTNANAATIADGDYGEIPGETYGETPSVPLHKF